MVLIRDFINYTHPSLSRVLEPAWKLLVIHLPVYIHTGCYGREPEEGKAEPKTFADEYPHNYVSLFDDDEPGIEGMTKQLIDLITTLIINPAIHTLIRTGLTPFSNAICSYLLLPQDHLDQYKHHLLYFFEDSQQIYSDIVLENSESIRSSCTRVIETLTETFGSTAVEVLQKIAFDNIRNVITAPKIVKKSVPAKPIAKKPSKDKREDGKENTYETVSVYDCTGDTYGKHDLWRKQELGLFLLFSLSDDLFVAYGKNLKFVNVPYLIEQLNLIMSNKTLASNGLLLGRMLATGAELLQLIPKENAICLQFINLSCLAITSDHCASVKIIACKCLVRFAHHIQSLPIKDPSQILEKVFSLQLESPSEILHITTETLYALFHYSDPRKLSPYLKHIIPSYVKLVPDSETELHDFVELLQRLSKNELYLAPIIQSYIPLLGSILETYPTKIEGSVLKVIYRLIVLAFPRCI